MVNQYKYIYFGIALFLGGIGWIWLLILDWRIAASIFLIILCENMNRKIPEMMNERIIQMHGDRIESMLNDIRPLKDRDGGFK